MIYQFDYYVKRSKKTGGHYAVCFSSVTKVDPEYIIQTVNNILELNHEPGIVYDITVVEIPSGVEEHIQVKSIKGEVQ